MEKGSMKTEEFHEHLKPPQSPTCFVIYIPLLSAGGTVMLYHESPTEHVKFLVLNKNLYAVVN